MARNPSWTARLPWMLAFAVAMAWLESAVVAYLRALYYPGGFAFPLAPIDVRLALIELGREAATLVMLFAPGALLTRGRLARFAWFAILFGVWDVFYYIWLKVFLDWPGSLFTADLLFLIPAPWVGPVLAPCIVSAGLVGLGMALLHRLEREPGFRVSAVAWAWLAAGAGLILASFLQDPLQHLAAAGARPWSVAAAGGAGLEGLAHYVPGPFPWWWFLAGCGAAAVGMWKALARGRAW